MKSIVVTVMFSLTIPVATCMAQDTTKFPILGHVDRFDPSLDGLISQEAKIEVLCGGFEWAEGPVWVPEEGNKFGGYVLFSDVPRNVVMKWQEGRGATVFMKPAGYTGVTDYGREPGSNGLALDAEGRLVLCEHGDRRISVLTKDGGKRTLADRWNGKRLNSPNDLAIRSSGDIFFTDPFYGLPKGNNDPRREMDFCGVYRLQKDGTVTLQCRDISRPNGIGFSPDEKILYVANSDGKDPVWRAFPVQADGNLGPPKIFFDASKDDRIPRGGGDGLKVDVQGNVFATGPGGVLVLSPEGKLLGRIVTGVAIANVGWGGDGSVLYLTSDMYLCRIRTKTKGIGLALAADPRLDTAGECIARGEQRFRDNDIAGSLRDFDRAAELGPRSAPHLWQRGISHYYAGRYDDGRRQFETHKAVNPHDVENAAWHFLCVAKKNGLGAARKAIIEIDTTRDTRVPMAEIYEWYAGRGTADAALKAAETAGTEQARMYAHLYLGLYYEVAGDAEKSKRHLRRSAAAKLENDYMHDVARIHLLQRGWQDDQATPKQRN